MAKAIIIDDEQNNIDNLEALLQQLFPGLDITAVALNAAEGRAVIGKYKPDLLFLDIQMPGETGFDLLKSLGHCSFELIFVTAHDQYGIQAVKFAAIDYLLKPLDPAELKQAVEKALERIARKQQNLQLENLIHLLKQQQRQEDDRIALTTLKETRFVETGRITSCESTNNYCTFYLADGEKLLVSKPIYEFETLLADYGFIRCHQSHLVNRRFIKSWKKADGDFLQLENGREIPVSRNKKEMVKQELLKKSGRH